MPLKLAQQIVHEWTGEEFELQDHGSDVPMLQSARSHDGGNLPYPQRAINSLDALVRTPPCALRISCALSVHVVLRLVWLRDCSGMHVRLACMHVIRA